MPARAEVINHHFVEVIFAVGRSVQQANDVKQSCLTTSTRSHNDDKFALFYRQVYPIQRKMLGVTDSKALRHAAKLNTSSRVVHYLFIMSD